jgi:hypothetical protein
MHGRQVTKKDLALLMMDLDPETNFDAAIKTVNEMLNQHPEGDTQRIRQLLEFEMLDAMMEAEVRSEEELLIESIVNLSRLGDDFPYESLPDSVAEKAKSRRSFEDDFAAEILPFDKRDQNWYLVVTYDADITEDQHQEILSIVDDLNSKGHQLYLRYSPSKLTILSPSKIHDARTGGHYPNSVFPNYGDKWPHLTNPFKRLGFRSDYYEHPMSNMPYGDPMQEEYETYVEEFDGYDDELLSFEEWLEQEVEYDRQLQEYGDSDEYAEAMEKALQEDYEMQQELDAENYAGDYMVQSDVARIMDSAARLTMMTPPDETYSEWWKSQLSVVADKIDGLADYLEDRYAEETDGRDAEMRYAPEFYVHSFDEYFGPYDSLEDAEEAVERFSRRGIVVTGITRGQERMAETFEAPYAGKGSLFSLGQSDALSGLTAKELTESSAIHGDFDSASLNYSGKQNLEVRTAETRRQANLPIPNPDMAQMYYRSLLE